jgi:Arc/MetJ family transcription regulator
VTARVTSVRRFTRTVIDLDDAALEEAAKEPAL